MFYAHNIDESIELNKNLHAVARLNIVTNDNWVTVEKLILQLQSISVNGLPDCYTSFGDYLYDMYPELSWGTKLVDELRQLQNDSRFVDICSGITKLFDFDFAAEINKATEESCADLD